MWKPIAVYIGEPQDIREEDSGCAKIAHIDDGQTRTYDEGMFVRIQSWSDRKNHKEFDQIVGKNVRVTIEVEEEEKKGLPPLDLIAYLEMARIALDRDDVRDQVMDALDCSDEEIARLGNQLDAFMKEGE